MYRVHGHTQHEKEGIEGILGGSSTKTPEENPLEWAPGVEGQRFQKHQPES